MQQATASHRRPTTRMPPTAPWFPTSSAWSSTSRTSLRLIEQTIARETSPETSPGGPESSTNVIVLDDVSPRYMKAAAALQACDVNLGIALRSLLDPGDSDPASLPALSVIGA